MSVEITGLPSKPLPGNGDSAQTGVTNTNSNNPQSTSAVALPTPDSITLTRQAENLRSLEADINAQSAVDDERVEHLKLAISSGQFDINPRRVAEKFIQFESQFVA